MQSFSRLDLPKSGSDKAVRSGAEERGKNKQIVTQWAKDISLELQIKTFKPHSSETYEADQGVAAFFECFGPSEGPDC